MLIGDVTAELLKKYIGSVHPSADKGVMEVRGRNLMSGLPATIQISSAEVREAMSEQIAHIIDCIRNTLEKTPPEISSDIYDVGIMLAGGGALINGLDILLTQLTGIKATVAKRPLDCVAAGIGKVIESSGSLKNIVIYRNR